MTLNLSVFLFKSDIEVESKCEGTLCAAYLEYTCISFLAVLDIIICIDLVKQKELRNLFILN